MTNPIYPFPEAIERNDIEGSFEIESGFTSSTNLSKRKMVVQTGEACPDCGKDHARATRLREMGRTAWTPSDWEKRVKRTKDRLSVRLVEDCDIARINFLRKHNGLEMSPPIYCEVSDDYYFLVRQFVRAGDMVGLAGFIVASYETEDYEGVERAVKRVSADLDARATVKDSAQARMIESLFVEVGWYIRHNYRYGPRTFRYAIALARDIVSNTKRINEAMMRTLAEAEEKKAIAAVKGITKITTYKRKTKKSGSEMVATGSIPDVPKRGEFGVMEIVQLPLPYRSKAGFERRWTARDEGPIPTRFDRWSIDKRVFRTKKRGKGAALLVDVSGSMSWEEDDLTRVLEEVPAATIAIYSGSGNKGQLVILAKDGKCASMRQAAKHMLGGNIIDGPALEWLAAQPQTTKLWMSDGVITGIGDGGISDEERINTNHIIRKGGIQQVRNVKAVMKVLTGKRPFTPSTGVSKIPWYDSEDDDE